MGFSSPGRSPTAAFATPRGLSLGAAGGLCRGASRPRPELPRPCFAFRQSSFFCPSHFNLPLEEREGRAASITMKRAVFFSYFQNCSKLKGAYNLRYKLQNQNYTCSYAGSWKAPYINNAITIICANKRVPRAERSARGRPRGARSSPAQPGRWTPAALIARRQHGQLLVGWKIKRRCSYLYEKLQEKHPIENLSLCLS